MGLVENKNCVVTGAAGSIGLATARLLAGEGAKVVLVDFNAARLAEVAREFDPALTRSCVADITDPAQVRDFVLQAVEAFGPIDVLFSNAGNDGPLSPIADYPEDMAIPPNLPSY